MNFDKVIVLMCEKLGISGTDTNINIMEQKLDKQTDFLNGYQLIIVKNGYSNKISVWEDNEGQRLVVRRPGKTLCYDSEVIALTPFLNPDKLNKEFAILKFLEAQGLPIARCIHHEQSKLSVYEWAIGEELNFQDCARRQINERVGIGINLGKFLGQFHNSQQGHKNQIL